MAILDINKRMPNKDQTGPEGRGLMTGRKAGKCGGRTSSELPRRGLGLGRRMGLSQESRTVDKKD